MPFDQTTLSVNDQEPVARDAFAATDQFVQGEIAKLTGGHSPLMALEAWANWLSHLALSPGNRVGLVPPSNQPLRVDGGDSPQSKAAK